MVATTINYKELTDYKFAELISLHQFLYQPSSSLFKTLSPLKKETYESNERIVFYFSGTIPYDLLAHLQRVIVDLDIPNFFVAMCNTDPGTPELLEKVRATYSQEDNTIQLITVDIIDRTEYPTGNHPLLNPPTTICQYPWTSLQFGPTGVMRPCCILKNPIQHNGKDINIADNPTFKEIYFSDTMVSLRSEFRNGGQPSECSKCWAEEAAGKLSDRLTYNSHRPRFSVDYESENINNLVSFDTELGNLCNLACRMCNPYSSSTWAAEVLEDLPRDQIIVHPAYLMKQQGTWPKSNDQYWDEFQAYLPQIRYLQFAGGEPMMIPYHFKLLRTAVESGDSAHIQLRYNSNGTVFNAEAVELWPHFEQVKVAFSIDNIGARFEYERYRGVWSEALETVRKFNQYRSSTFETEVSCTVNIQNAYYLPEIYEWFITESFDSLYINFLHNPTVLALSSLTPQAKEMVVARLTNYDFGRYQPQVNQLLNLIDQSGTSDGKEFCKFMKELDKRRNQNFADTHPEMAKAMGY